MDNIFYLITRQQSAISNQQSAISNQQSAIANLNFFNNIFSLIFYKAISALHNFFNFAYNIISIILNIIKLIIKIVILWQVYLTKLLPHARKAREQFLLAIIKNNNLILSRKKFYIKTIYKEFLL